jgi:uncharacterized protein YigA (DUF484 family)
MLVPLNESVHQARAAAGIARMTAIPHPLNALDSPAMLPSADAVVAFLAANPGFFAERPDLLCLLEPPARVHGESLADHMAAMVRAHRRRTDLLEQAMETAASASRAGQALAARVRFAVLALMRSRDVSETVTQEMPALLGIETCTLLAEWPDRPGVGKLPAGSLLRLLGTGREVLVRAVPTETPLLHQEAAGLVMRDALIRVPLGAGAAMLLALGARDPAALPLRQSAASLGFLGRAVAAALTRP